MKPLPPEQIELLRKALVQTVRLATKASAPGEAAIDDVNTLCDMAIASWQRTAPPEALAFTLQCAEELFGWHLCPAENGTFRCASCDWPIAILGWVTAEHDKDCFINRVRDYLATHKPECVPGHVCAPSPRGKPSRCAACDRTTPYGIIPEEDCKYERCPLKQSEPQGDGNG